MTDGSGHVKTESQFWKIRKALKLTNAWQWKFSPLPYVSREAAAFAFENALGVYLIYFEYPKTASTAPTIVTLTPAVSVGSVRDRDAPLGRGSPNPIIMTPIRKRTTPAAN
ncbi:MAG: hypothetical protein AUI93_05775 [Crenarchaeota archaeon 13_1_40CM_3_52_10]|nr:MAG: hypothetical protein AUI93_05775 [Crenarchaeota archaeon 13_1_40CM_3_52_10]